MLLEIVHKDGKHSMGNLDVGSLFTNIPLKETINICIWAYGILAYGHHKYILEIKESLLIKRDKLVLNKNISSAKLFLFDNN